MSDATEPGCFRARNDPPSSFYRAALEVAYVEGAKVDMIRRALTDVYTAALAELDRRFDNTDNRRQRADGERR